MNRRLYTRNFGIGDVPDWVCPECMKGILRVKKNSFRYEETAESKRNHNDDWEPYMNKYVYSCLLVCPRNICRGVVSSSGHGEVNWYQDYDDVTGAPEDIMADSFSPRYFHPPLNIFVVPRKTPKNVKEEIKQSFALFFCSPGSAANRIRIALEKLLTHLGVKRFVNANGKRHSLKLHNRIELLPNKYSGVKNLFLAVKWLGNAGSHATRDISSADVLDCYQILEEALNRLFDRNHMPIDILVNLINQNKGPRGN